MRPRRLTAGLALGAMAALWWWAFAGLGTSRLVTPEVAYEHVIVGRAPFGRVTSAVEYYGSEVVGRSRSNQTFLAGWAALLGGELLLGTLAAWVLGVRMRPRGFEEWRPDTR